MATAMQQISRHGQDRRYHHIRVGINGRMDTLQAAILLAKLLIFDEEVQKRVEIGGRYTAKLKDVVETPYIEPYNTCVYAQYTIRVDEREQVISKLKAVGVPTAVHYPLAIHQQPAFLESNRGLSHSARAAAQVMSLPMHAYLKPDAQLRITDAVRVALS